jgi:hypothetical protein
VARSLRGWVFLGATEAGAGVRMTAKSAAIASEEAGLRVFGLRAEFEVRRMKSGDTSTIFVRIWQVLQMLAGD